MLLLGSWQSAVLVLLFGVVLPGRCGDTLFTPPPGCPRCHHPQHSPPWPPLAPLSPRPLPYGLPPPLLLRFTPLFCPSPSAPAHIPSGPHLCAPLSPPLAAQHKNSTLVSQGYCKVHMLQGFARVSGFLLRADEARSLVGLLCALGISAPLATLSTLSPHPTRKSPSSPPPTHTHESTHIHKSTPRRGH